MFSAFRKKRIWLAAIAALIGMVGSLSAQQIQGTETGFGGQNSITGTVLTPSGQRMELPIAIRLSTMTKGDRIAYTDNSGNFGFRGLPNGDYQLVIDKEKDYEPFSYNVSVFQMRGAPGGNYMVSIRLKNKAAPAPKPGVVNADLAGIPKDALELFNKAGELATKGDRAGAIEQLNAAIAVHPTFMLAFNEIGVQYMKLNELQKSDEALQAALKIEPEAFTPLWNRCLVLVAMKKYAEAEPPLRKAVAAKPDMPAAHYFLGQALANLGKFDEAEKELSTATLAGAKEMVEAHRLLAIIYSSKGDKKRAAAQLEKYLELNPNTPDAEQLRKVIEQFKTSGGTAATSNPKPS